MRKKAIFNCSTRPQKIKQLPSCVNLMPIKYTNDDIINITIFEKITRTHVVDYANENNTLYFVVKTNNFKNLIGKNGIEIKKLQKKMNQNIIIYKHTENAEEFTKNMLPIPAKKITLIENNQQKTITIETEKRNKGLLIGRGGKNINIIKIFLKRQFNIDNIKIE
ncbi:MAG: NusA-like transcription termination signal-binding factor [Candidatus Nanohalarchaeota archaeon]|nr:MAG: NusA-like transcription termination signal-binding factor [Candidatus Nanohaloarchaeota archaeon]